VVKVLLRREGVILKRPNDDEVTPLSHATRNRHGESTTRVERCSTLQGIWS